MTVLGHEQFEYNIVHRLGGVNFDDSGQLITDLDYADGGDIFADLFDTLKDASLIFNTRSSDKLSTI